MDMIENNSETPKRIPVRFVDDEAGRTPEGADDTALTPGEIGRASIYEGETEVRRRIDRGAEEEGGAGRGAADDRDVAGSLPGEETPEAREDKDTNPRRASAPEQPQARGRRGLRHEQANAFGGPSVSAQAELLAAQAELQMVVSELERAKAERQELSEQLARRQADFDNYRKRIERERDETRQRIVGEVVSQLLPVLDNLRRALEAESSAEAGESEEFRNFLHGIGLINRQLSGVLEGLGVEVVPTVGRRFDPHFHEAIATEQTDRYEPDTVTQEVQRGYRLGDKLLRPAMVKVATRQ